MNLYITRRNSPSGEILAAYWAESRGDVIDAYELDGIDVEIGCTMLATPEEALLYHDPDFDGRKAWLVFDDSVAMMRYINSLGADTSGLLYGIAADNYQAAIDFDPAPFREKRVCITGLRSEADAHLEPGWNQ